MPASRSRADAVLAYRFCPGPNGEKGSGSRGGWPWAKSQSSAHSLAIDANSSFQTCTWHETNRNKGSMVYSGVIARDLSLGQYTVLRSLPLSASFLVCCLILSLPRLHLHDCSASQRCPESWSVQENTWQRYFTKLALVEKPYTVRLRSISSFQRGVNLCSLCRCLIYRNKPLHRACWDIGQHRSPRLEISAYLVWLKPFIRIHSVNLNCSNDERLII